jgi:pyochelin biosynthetic protein PchC
MTGGVGVLRAGTSSGTHLVCLPFAGGSSRSFEPLARAAPRSWWIGVPECRASCDFAPTLDELAEATARTVRSLGAHRLLVLGHSLGAVVGYRAAQVLGGDWPADGTLVLSAPQRFDTAARNAAQLAALEPDRLVHEVRRLGLLSDHRHSDDVLRRLVLPAFRRNLAALAGYRHSPAPLPTRPVVLAGRHDRWARLADLHQLAGELGARVCEIDGDHLFVVSRPRAVIDVLVDLTAPARRYPEADLSIPSLRS